MWYFEGENDEEKTKTIKKITYTKIEVAASPLKILRARKEHFY